MKGRRKSSHEMSNNLLAYIFVQKEILQNALVELSLLMAKPTNPPIDHELVLVGGLVHLGDPIYAGGYV